MWACRLRRHPLPCVRTYCVGDRVHPTPDNQYQTITRQLKVVWRLCWTKCNNVFLSDIQVLPSAVSQYSILAGSDCPATCTSHPSHDLIGFLQGPTLVGPFSVSCIQERRQYERVLDGICENDRKVLKTSIAVHSRFHWARKLSSKPLQWYPVARMTPLAFSSSLGPTARCLPSSFLSSAPRLSSTAYPRLLRLPPRLIEALRKQNNRPVFGANSLCVVFLVVWKGLHRWEGPDVF